MIKVQKPHCNALFLIAILGWSHSGELTALAEWTGSRATSVAPVPLCPLCHQESSAMLHWWP
ncbi:hypothetical protein TSMEX_008520 [Taenia solium]|eukprot:TsM_000344300 transcript=TsM_000344300 gene=TsM_000344300